MRRGYRWLTFHILNTESMVVQLKNLYSLLI
nr:MAG TPA: hypothetical protein [Caudoviricetes sp.]